MTQAERKALWDELKEAGFTFTKHYRDYSIPELQESVEQVRQRTAARARSVAENPEDELSFDFAQSEIQFQADIDILREQPADRVPGLRTNTHAGEKPIRIDENGRVWLQDEIRKPSIPTERGKRVLDYVDPGVKTVHVRDGNGSIVESFEMPGDSKKISQARISLPAYQIGCFRDPALLGQFFKIHVYNEKMVFDFFDVERYFGGKHMIPQTVQREYTDTMLGFNIESVLQAIQDEYNDKILKGEIKA